MLQEFKRIIGLKAYSAFLDMLATIGPEARTQRISVVIAVMLKFARSKVSEKPKPNSLAAALLALEEEPYETEGRAPATVRALVDALCREAGMRNQRQTSRGESYSIADAVIAEYVEWYNMPWE